ncbi:rCG23942 [Rattus norvegicus]|uniref:RCG23942 n=1 Tax=Rattus norvegicus TaxID=10116 RepID=A6JVR8_RAT|nr:rCG23942 [Rattus norvegicus]
MGSEPVCILCGHSGSFSHLYLLLLFQIKEIERFSYWARF